MKEYVRTILDYPVKGIQFRDITTLLQNSEYFNKVIDQMTEPWKDEKIDAIYTSTLSRTVDTAKEINKYHNLKIEKLKELDEINFGIFV